MQGTMSWMQVQGARTCVLLIWLLEKKRENSKCRSSSQMSSSHFFLPRSSRIGREQKSSCQALVRGTLLASGAEVASASATGWQTVSLRIMVHDSRNPGAALRMPLLGRGHDTQRDCSWQRPQTCLRRSWICVCLREVCFRSNGRDSAPRPAQAATLLRAVSETRCAALVDTKAD